MGVDDNVALGDGFCPAFDENTLAAPTPIEKPTVTGMIEDNHPLSCGAIPKSRIARGGCARRLIPPRRSPKTPGLTIEKSRLTDLSFLLQTRSET